MKISLIYLGAEAAVLKGEFLGLKAVFKVRVPKPYRDPKLDSKLRYVRTLTEARILTLARLKGVRVPAVYLVDLESSTLVMESVEGKPLRDVLRELGDGGAKYMYLFGVEAGKLHKMGVAHGDLTTSNAVVRDGEVYIIDFGLARHTESLEDFGTDVHLLLRSLESVHYAHKDLYFKEFLKGYGEVLGNEWVGTILKKVSEIRLRGRYIEERRERK